MIEPTTDGTPDEVALREAAAWMARLTERGSGPDDREALRRWLAAHPRNAAAMDLVERAWYASGLVDGTPGLLAERARARRLRVATSGIGRRGSRLWFAPAAGAGALALVAVVALALLPPTNYGWSSTHRTALGQSLETSLPDGSLVRLNTDTEIRVDYGWFGRRLALTRGEAEFVVAHGDLRTFSVAVNGMEVRATGTVFTVRDTGDGTRVFLLEGGVQVRDGDQGGILAVLRPGERAVLDGAGLVGLDPTDPAAERAWRTGQIVFNATPLPDALAEFARYAHVDVRISDALRSVAVSGVYRATDLMAFLDALARIHPVAWRQIGPGVVVLEPVGAAAVP